MLLQEVEDLLNMFGCHLPLLVDGLFLMFSSVYILKTKVGHEGQGGASCKNIRFLLIWGRGRGRESIGIMFEEACFVSKRPTISYIRQGIELM